VSSGPGILLPALMSGLRHYAISCSLARLAFTQHAQNAGLSLDNPWKLDHSGSDAASVEMSDETPARTRLRRVYRHFGICRGFLGGRGRGVMHLCRHRLGFGLQRVTRRLAF
jgi:hypothetical protein